MFNLGSWMTYFPGLGVMIKPQKHLSHMQKGPYTLLLSHCHADTKKTLSMVFKVPKLWVHLSTKNSCKDVGISDIYFYKILQCAFQRLSFKAWRSPKQLVKGCLSWNKKNTIPTPRSSYLEKFNHWLQHKVGNEEQAMIFIPANQHL